MLMAYNDIGGVRIKDVPFEETRVPLFPIPDLKSAQDILVVAKRERPDLEWEIKERSGQYSVRSKTL
jgi:hypothetical protein